MPRSGATAQATKFVEPEKPQWKVITEPEEDMEDDVEYEEIEEEIEEEFEEEVEVEEEIEEEVEEEEEEVEEEEVAVAKTETVEPLAITAHGDDKKDDELDIHDELLALPPHGAEVYIGGLSSDVSDEDLRSFCETVGEVVAVRILSGKDKVYAFVTFRTKELAKDAIETLNNTEFKGKRIKLSTSQAKNKLFIGNVPRGWTEEDLRNVVSKIGPGVIGVQLIKDTHSSSRNRGFAFIEYYNNACAEFCRKKMSVPEFKLESNALTVSWADPKSGDSSSAAQIKAIYVKNLPKSVTEEKLKKLFERHGKITKVALPNVKSGQENRIGFVHFAERSSAMKALQNTEIYELDGHVLECSIAKPPADKKAASVTVTDLRKGTLLPNYRHQPGLLGDAYGVQPASFGQPMAYGRGPVPGVTMVPMILPDGRFGYVLQEPGVAALAAHNRNQQGHRIAGGHRYRPY